MFARLVKALGGIGLVLALTQTPLISLAQNAWPTEKKITFLQEFLDGQPTDFRQLKEILPEDWLHASFAAEDEKELLKQQLATARTENQPSQISWLSLQLEYINLAPTKRDQLLDRAQQEMRLMISREQAEKLSQEAALAQQQQQQVQAQLTYELSQSTSDFEKELLMQAKALEVAFTQLTQTISYLANQKNALLDTIQKKRAMGTAIQAKLEDIENGLSRNHQAWTDTLRDTEEALRESNKRIANKTAFEEMYVPAIQAPYESMLSAELLAYSDTLEEDHPLRKTLQAYRLRRTAYKTERLLLEDQITAYRQNMIAAEKNLRDTLMETRSTILSYEYRNHWQPQHNLRSPLETLAFESRCLLAQGLFQMWTLHSSLFQSSSAELPVLKKIWRMLTISFRWIYVALIVLLGWWLVQKKQPWLEQMRTSIARMTTARKNKKRLYWALELLEDFYLFLLVGIIGYWFVRLATKAGFTKATLITPYISLFMIYFLGKGLLEALVPMISQRKHGTYGKEKGEVLAIESTFRLVPFYILTYWALGRTVTLILEQSLLFSEMGQWLKTAWWFGLLPLLLIGVYRNRAQWRRTCVYVSDHPRWRKVLEKSKDRFWEPLILLIGGGAGVYLIAWRRIGLRVVEARVTRSFQAMVSRAVYERAKKDRIVRINFEDLPEGYAHAFGKASIWKPEWHIPQPQYQEKMQEYFNNWQHSNDGKTILIYGERGIGKSALIQQWLNEIDHPHQAIRLTVQDHNHQHLLETISQNLLGKAILDEKKLIEALNQMPPTVFVLERLENTVLRKVGGLDGFALLLHLMLRAKNHFWVCSINLHTWGFIQHGSLGVNCFSHYIAMEGMEEKDIQAMILKRHESFDSELNFQALASTTGKTATQNQSFEKEKELYFRILWDYTRGNPREAMYFWGTSVRVSENKTSVSLFDIPESEVLPTLPISCLNVLACIIEHNGIGMRELVTILDVPLWEMDRLIERLDSFGMLYREKDSHILHVEAFWYRSVSNYLVRRNMIFKGEHLA
jgi:hypothetical protein